MALSLAKETLQMLKLAQLKWVGVAIVLVFASAGVGIVVISRALAAGPASRAAAAPASQPTTNPAQLAIILQLQSIRTATIEANRSGRGVARLEYVDLAAAKPPGLAALDKSLPQHEIHFVFAGEDSLVTGIDAFNSDARLVRDKRVTRYFTGRPGYPAPASVNIDVLREPVLGDPNLPGWSFSDIARLPPRLIGPMGEQKFFTALASSPGAAIHQTGTILRLTVSAPVKPGAPPSRSVAYHDFDLAKGGMLTHAHYENVIRRDGEDVNTAEDWQIGWAEKDGHVVPTSRVAEFTSAVAGKLEQGDRCIITFDRISFESVDPDLELTVDRMGIAPGTRVADLVKGVDWTYPNRN